MEKVIELLHKLQGVSVLCVGDIMLDRFVYGEAARCILRLGKPGKR